MQSQSFGPYPTDSGGVGDFGEWCGLSCALESTGAAERRCLPRGDRGGWETCWREFRSFGPEREQSCGGSAKAAWEQACSPSPFPVFTLTSRALIFAFLSLGFMKFNFQGVSEYPVHLIMLRW